MDLKYTDYVTDPHGGFRQRDLTVTQVYDIAYLRERYAAIDDRVRELSLRRLAVLRAIIEISDGCRLLDFGCGTGAFVDCALRSGIIAYGHDLLYYGPIAKWGSGWSRGRFVFSICDHRFVDGTVAIVTDDSGCWCRACHNSLTSDRPLPRQIWNVATFFDSLEHLPDPASTIRRLAAEWLMVSVPECHRPHVPCWFMRWKHRRPGEHLWHWNRRSLGTFLAALGYREVMVSNFEDDYRPNPAQVEPNILTGIYRRAKDG